MAKLENGVITFDKINGITTIEKLIEFEKFRYAEYADKRFNSYDDLMDPFFDRGFARYYLNYDRSYTELEQATVLADCQNLETRWLKNANPSV